LSAVSGRTTVGPAGATAWLERASVALPIVTVFFWASLIHGWQAWSIATPWLFTDELEFTQLSRAIAETGHPARRGVEYPWTTLYVLVTAPAWLVRDTDIAYTLAKLIGAMAMSAAALPAYGLSRMLTSRGPALFAAVATVTIPAFMYTGLLIQEPLAYFWSTLALYLVVRSLVRRRRLDFALAAAAVAVAPLVRGELAVLVPVYAVAAGWLAFRSERWRRWTARWSSWDRAGAALLLLGLLVVANAWLSHESEAWQISTRLYKDRILDHALWAGGALVIGIGLLPLVAGLAALFRPRRETPPAALRPFAAVLVASIVGFGTYAAVKGAYLSTVFGTRVAERNLIYLAPLFFVATALWLERPRLRPAPLALATGLAALLVATTRFQLEYPYFEAPGFTILALANRTVELPGETIRLGLYGVLAFVVVLAVLPSLLERRRSVRTGLLAAAAMLVVAWNVVGETGAVRGSRQFSDAFAAHLPRPLDWVDEATGGESAVYVAQYVSDPTGIWSHEFWNRSIKKVWSLDGSAPPPGPTLTPDVVRLNGVLFPNPEVDYAVAEAGVDLVGPVVARRGTVRVIRIGPEMQVRRLLEGVFSDGWMGGKSAYSQYSTPGGRPGTMNVSLSRAGGGANLHASVEIRLGPLVLDAKHQPRIARVTERRTWQFGNEDEPTKEFAIPTPPPPFRVEVRISPTFRPSEIYPGSGDIRRLGAKALYVFQPSD
jgi:hypothetical protein